MPERCSGGGLEFYATLFTLESGNPRRVKPLLYVYRVILTGIHLMPTGSVGANLLRLNEEFNLAYAPELVAQNGRFGEGYTRGGGMGFHKAEYCRLLQQLETEASETRLPAEANCREALNDLLVRIRLHSRRYWI